MAPAWVEPSLDELEDGFAGLLLVLEPPPVDELASEGGEEQLSHMALSYAPPTAPIDGRTPAPLQRFPKTTDGYRVPLTGVCMGSRGLLFLTAMSSAATTISLGRWFSMVHPTMRRLDTSSTTAT